MASDVGLPVLPCACASLRRAARAVTQLYDGELRAAGLNTPQYTLLQVLASTGPVTQGRLGALLALDSTTLSRTLRPLEARGWVRSRPGEDRRERHLELTRAGRSRLERAVASWERAQERLRSRIGGREWGKLLATLSRIAGAARRA
jgi:DNA-binding MarR family transcriptional regulator